MTIEQMTETVSSLLDKLELQEKDFSNELDELDKEIDSKTAELKELAKHNDKKGYMKLDSELRFLADRKLALVNSEVEFDKELLRELEKVSADIYSEFRILTNELYRNVYGHLIEIVSLNEEYSKRVNLASWYVKKAEEYSKGIRTFTPAKVMANIIRESRQDTRNIAMYHYIDKVK